MTTPIKPYTQQPARLVQAASGTLARLMKGTKSLMQISKSTRRLGIRTIKILSAIVAGLTVALIGTALALFFTTSGQYPVLATVLDDASLPQIEINGVRLHAETYGDPSNPVIIVLHGGPGGDYRSQLGAKSLADTNFVVFYDQRGAGLSERVPAEELTVRAYMAELDAVIEKYSPDRPVTLLGHSWGRLRIGWCKQNHL